MEGADPLGLEGQVLHGRFYVDSFVRPARHSFIYRATVNLLPEVPVRSSTVKPNAREGSLPVALKVLRPPLWETRERAGVMAFPEAFLRRFRHETRIHHDLAQRTPHVVRVIASGTALPPRTGRLTPFLALEWLDGETLEAHLAGRAARGRTGRTFADAVRLLDPVVEALAFAHAHGVVHRELSPARIYVTRDGDLEALKLLDLGRATMAGGADAEAPPSTWSGNLAYAAPEQLDRALGVMSPATDVYPLAVILLELLRDRPVTARGAGAPPGDDWQPTPRTLGLPAGDTVEGLFRRATAPRPCDRPSDIGEFWGELKHALGVDATPGAPARPAHRPHVAIEPAPNSGTLVMAGAPPIPAKSPEPLGEDEPTSGEPELFVSSLALAVVVSSKTAVSPAFEVSAAPFRGALSPAAPAILKAAVPYAGTMPSPQWGSPDDAAPVSETKNWDPAPATGAPVTPVLLQPPIVMAPVPDAALARPPMARRPDAAASPYFGTPPPPFAAPPFAAPPPPFATPPPPFATPPAPAGPPLGPAPAEPSRAHLVAIAVIVFVCVSAAAVTAIHFLR